MKGGALLVRAATERVLLVVLSVKRTALDLVAMIEARKCDLSNFLGA